MDKLNIPSYNALFLKQNYIRAIQELYESFNKLIDDPDASAFNPSWRTTGTLEEFCADVVADPDAVVGDVFLGQVSCSGLPEGMSNGELEVKVTQGQEDKLLVLTLTSTNLAPYHWEQSYYDGTLYGWKASDPAGAAAAVEVALTGTDQDTAEDITLYGTRAYSNANKTSVIGTAQDDKDADTIFGAKAYSDYNKSSVVGTSQDPTTADTINGAKAFATNAVAAEALRTNNYAAIVALASDTNAATTTTTTNPEWKLVYTDADDRILLGKRQDDTWYFAADLDDILDVIIDGYGT